MAATKTARKTSANVSKKLSSETRNTNQSWFYESIHQHCGEALRVEIRVNAYANQSHATIEIYNPTAKAWNPLASIPFDAAHYEANRVVYVLQSVSESAFLRDEQRLLAKAALILNHARKA